MTQAHASHGSHSEHPVHIQKYKDLRRKVDLLLDTTKMHGRQAYDAAAMAHLMTDDGYLDYERLGEEDIQEKFSESMVQAYAQRARERFKSDLSANDEFENDLLLSAYAGVTGSEIRDLIRKRGKGFTFDVYNQLLLDDRNPQSIMGRMKERLKDTASAHLSNEHINDIVRYTGVGDFVHTDKMRREEAVELMNIYHEQGAIGPKMIENAVYADKEYFRKGHGHHDHKKAA